MNPFRATIVLHYLSPACLTLFLLFSYGIESCRIVPVEKRALPKPRFPRYMLCLLLTILSTYTIDISEAFHSLATRAEPPQSLIIYSLSSFLYWSIIALNTTLPWHTFIGSAVVSMAFEVALVTVGKPQDYPEGKFDQAIFAIQLLRIGLLTLLAISATAQIAKPAVAAKEETQPLLSTTSDPNDPKYGSIDTNKDSTSATNSDDSENEDDPWSGESGYMRKKKQERLEQSGSWIAYLSAYKVFLPFIIPTRDLKVQLCLVVVILTLVLGRVMNVLLPVMLGKITDKLAEANVTHKAPIREICIWIGFSWLNSSAFRDCIENLALIPLRQFTYRELTMGAFNHLMNLSIDFHNDKDTVEVIQAVQQGHALSDLLETFFLTIAPGIVDLVIAYGYFYHFFDIYVSFVIFIASVIYVYVDRKGTDWQNESRREYIKANREEYQILNNAISGWSVISYFNRFVYERNRVRQAVVKYQSTQLKYSVIRGGASTALTSTIIKIARLIVSILVAIRIANGKAPVGSFITFYSYFRVLVEPIQTISHQYRWLSGSLIDAERLLVLFQTKPTITNKPEAKALKVHSGGIRMKNVGFSYDPRKLTLSGIDIDAKPGTTIAFVGETGAGKSTLFKLLFRFYDVTEGSIEIDGQDVRDVTLDSLREAIGVVPQDSHLFNVSIKENLLYAKLEATQEEIEAACKAAAVHDKIMSFPDKYESKVGERGVKLSGGEQQRIAIARILLKNPKIVLLDEATSAVDTDTEVKIQAAFKELSKDRTTFVIAHRLSTIVHADLIVVLQDGKVIETGKHKELVELHGKYHSLWSKQVAATLDNVVADEAGFKKAEEKLAETKETGSGSSSTLADDDRDDNDADGS